MNHPPIAPHPLTGRQRTLLRQIEAAGFTVEFRPYVEDRESPGFLGAYAGRTDRERREVVISTARASAREIGRRLAHELRHVQEPDWDCGSRPVIRPDVVLEVQAEKVAALVRRARSEK